MFAFPDRFAKLIRIVPAPDDTAGLVRGDCWMWIGRCNVGRFGATSEAGPDGETGGRGYGQVWFAGKAMMAHRVIYKLMCPYVDIDDRVLDHLCRRRSCVNPLHLEPTSVSINTLRGTAILFKIARKYADRHVVCPPTRTNDDVSDLPPPRSPSLEDVPF